MLSVKTIDRGNSAMTASSALKMAQEESKKQHCNDGGGCATNAVSEAGVSIKKNPDLMQFKWAKLEIGKPAPGFRGMAVVHGDFKEIAMEDYLGRWLLFLFYPLDFTFVCPTELVAFSDRSAEFETLNCAVVACSTDSHYSHLAWINTPRSKGGLGSMQIPILSDKTAEIARRWGVMKEDEGIAFRGVFLVDPAGNLRQITINDLAVGRCIDEALRLVQAYRYTDEHGEVCPMNWRPGEPSIVPTVGQAELYFQEKYGNKHQNI